MVLAPSLCYTERNMSFLPLIETAVAAGASNLPAIPTIELTGTCIVPGLICTSAGSSGLSLFIFAELLPFMQIAFVAVGFLMFMYYGLRLILENSEDSTNTEVKQAYTYGITAAVIVGFASLIISAVGQGNEATLINTAATNNIMALVGTFYRLFLSIAVSAVIVFQGIRLIVLQGDEGEFEKQRGRFLHTLAGVTIILLADTLVHAFLPGAGSPLLAQEIVGIINFLLTVAGALAVLSFIVAGVFLLFSTDDALKERAKKTVVGAIIAIIVILASATIVHFLFHL